jgi:phage shock protein PspC (stress-responsive transcriptional regulator)
MNKTLTINISGIIFNIEEDAYENLKNYLSNIKRHFQNEEGCDEIVADIEARLAELLKSKTSAGKQVLINSDVNEAIGVMGKPEDFDETKAAENEKANNTNQSHYSNKRRRVFRDPDGKVLGGVCSGVANYFDTDPLWIRLALVVMFFGFGSGFLLYIILWVIIPEAKTTAEKLEMRGEPIDVNTISKTIKDEAENFKNRAKDFGNDMKTGFANRRGGINRFADFMHNIFYGIVKVVSKIIGVFFVFFGLILFVGLLSVLIGFGTIDNLSVTEFMNSFAGPEFPIFWFKVGFTLAVGIPLVMFVYKGMKMILGVRFHNRWINITAGVLWLAGLSLSLMIGIKFANEFSQDAILKQQVDVKWPANDTMYLKSNANYKTEDNDVKFFIDNERWHINTTAKPAVWWGKPHVKIITSENDSVYVLIEKSSNGKDKTEASRRAKGISYKLEQLDSVLMLDKYFSFNSSDKFRDQEVDVVIKLPKNKTIFLDNSLRKLYYDIENTNGIIDYEMGGKFWKMTENGLTCLNCPKMVEETLIIKTGKKVSETDAKVNIDENGIDIKSKDATVKIDQEGIRINSKDAKDEEND